MFIQRQKLNLFPISLSLFLIVLLIFGFHFSFRLHLSECPSLRLMPLSDTEILTLIGQSPILNNRESVSVMLIIIQMRSFYYFWTALCLPTPQVTQQCSSSSPATAVDAHECLKRGSEQGSGGWAVQPPTRSRPQIKVGRMG